MVICKKYKDVPIACRICKFFLQDDFFIEEYSTMYICEWNDEISSNLLGFGCEEFKVAKWSLVDCIQNLIKERYKFLCTMMCGEIELKDMKPCKDIKDPTIVCPKCGNCTWYIVPITEGGSK